MTTTLSEIFDIKHISPDKSIEMSVQKKGESGIELKRNREVKQTVFSFPLLQVFRELFFDDKSFTSFAKKK